ncbi:MAG TPA: hypothetical protein VKU87_00260, partial [Thermomicrobiaceae bacterium]|nr:hypothetical protein [Thermomicrobiaceae bacterium]
MDQLHFSFHIRQGGVELCYGGVRQLWVEWDAANELVMDLLDAEVRDEAYSYGDESNKYVDEVVA